MLKENKYLNRGTKTQKHKKVKTEAYYIKEIKK